MLPAEWNQECIWIQWKSRTGTTFVNHFAQLFSPNFSFSPKIVSDLIWRDAVGRPWNQWERNVLSSQWLWRMVYSTQLAERMNLNVWMLLNITIPREMCGKVPRQWLRQEQVQVLPCSIMRFMRLEVRRYSNTAIQTPLNDMISTPNNGAW